MPRVELVLGWRVAAGKNKRGAGTKCYVHRSNAYYALAKKLVLAKYPPWVNDPRGDGDNVFYRARDEAQAAGWTPEQLANRIRRAELLFCSRDHDRYGGWTATGPLLFDDRKWRAFVRRVAKFLVFVDDRRFRSHLHEQYERAMESAARGAEAYRYRKDDPR